MESVSAKESGRVGRQSSGKKEWNLQKISCSRNARKEPPLSPHSHLAPVVNLDAAVRKSVKAEVLNHVPHGPPKQNVLEPLPLVKPGGLARLVVVLVAEDHRDLHLAGRGEEEKRRRGEEEKRRRGEEEKRRRGGNGGVLELGISYKLARVPR